MADPRLLISRHRLAASIVLTSIPFAVLVLVVWRTHVDVPSWDEWEITTWLERLHNGTFRLFDLRQQHNEHRPMFGVGLILLLVRLTHWNVGAEVMANVGVGVLIFAVHARQVLSGWPAAYRRPLWLVPGLSLLIFSLSQSDNWLWGWQLTLWLNVLAVAAGLALLANLDGRWSRLAGAAACGVVATYSFAAGLVFWVVGLGAWWLNRSRVRPAQIAVWLIVAALTIASYLYDYQWNRYNPIDANFDSTATVTLYLVYAVKYLGAPVALFRPAVALEAGCAGLALFAWLAFEVRECIGRPIFTFTVLSGMNSVAVALMTGLGRTFLGSDQAITPRYVTFSTPLWVAIVVFAAFRLSGVGTARERPTWRRAEAAMIGAAVAVIVTMTLASAYTGTQLSIARRELLEPARRGLITGQDDRQLLQLYPNLEEVRRRRELLIAWHLSVFRSARAQQDSWIEKR